MVRKLFGVVAAVALASGAMLALVGPASAADDSQLPTLTITVHKVITGTPPGDQNYQVRVQCVHDDVQVFAQPQAISWASVDGTFTPSDANAVFVIPTRVGGSSDDITCTVLEVGTAGAASHTTECTGDTAPAVCAGDQVTITYAHTGDADLTVTNVYPEPVTPTPTPTPTPAPAPAVVAAARFTG